MNRRRFLQGAGFLLGSLGIPPIIQNELIKKVTGISRAEAATGGSGTVDFYIDVCVRSGSPWIWLGTGIEFTQLTTTRYPNVPLQMVSDLQVVGNTGGSRPMYVNMSNGVGTILAGAGASSAPANYIAITQGVDASSLGHDSLFCERRGGFGLNMTTPIIEFAERSKTRTDVGYIVNGTNMFRMSNGLMMNSTNSLPDLIDVNNIDAFGALFQKPTLRLNAQEVGLVLDAARGLSSVQARKLQNRIDNIALTQQAHSKAADLILTDFSQQVNTTQIMQQYAGFRATAPTGWSGDLGRGIASALLAFGNRSNPALMPAATITIDTNDWHGFQDPSYASLQTMAGVYVANILSAAISYMQATDHPFRPGEKLFDRTLISFTSEFTRGVAKANSDNGDGFTNGGMLIGGMIRGGYYGGFTLPDNQDGQALGFNLQTGAVTPNSRAPQGTIYHTVSHLLGNTTTNTAKVAQCMLRTG
jgi:hypothetical protein